MYHMDTHCPWMHLKAHFHGSHCTLTSSGSHESCTIMWSHESSLPCITCSLAHMIHVTAHFHGLTCQTHFHGSHESSLPWITCALISVDHMKAHFHGSHESSLPWLTYKLHFHGWHEGVELPWIYMKADFHGSHVNSTSMDQRETAHCWSITAWKLSSMDHILTHFHKITWKLGFPFYSHESSCFHGSHEMFRLPCFSFQLISMAHLRSSLPWITWKLTPMDSHGSSLPWITWKLTSMHYLKSSLLLDLLSYARFHGSHDTLKPLWTPWKLTSMDHIYFSIILGSPWKFTSHPSHDTSLPFRARESYTSLGWHESSLPWDHMEDFHFHESHLRAYLQRIIWKCFLIMTLSTLTFFDDDIVHVSSHSTHYRRSVIGDHPDSWLRRLPIVSSSDSMVEQIFIYSIKICLKQFIHF